MITKQQFFDITVRYGFPASKFVRDASDNSDAYIEYNDQPLFIWKENNGRSEAIYLNWSGKNMMSVYTPDQLEELVANVRLKFKKEFTTKRIEKIQEDF